MNQRPIDAHAHLPLPPDDRAVRLLGQWGIGGVVNICVDHGSLGGLDAQRQWYGALRRAFPDRFAWVTSFSLAGFGTAGWAERAVEQLRLDLDAGACGVKVWKNVGMELRDPATGDWVYVDDPRFDPVFRYLESRGTPLLTHIAEPIAAWSPLDPRNPHYGYYSHAKQWHWFGRTDVPSHDRLIASRDALLERYPKLPLVGLHLGSQEHDLSAVAERLRRYPQYRVDTGGRIGDMAVHAAERPGVLREFLREFAGRVFWGVDWVITKPWTELPDEQQARQAEAIGRHYALERRFYETTNALTVGPVATVGLGLSGELLEMLRWKAAWGFYFGGRA